MQTRTFKPAAAFAVVPLLALLVAAPSARAQALADRVPQDAILYIGWNGAGQMGPGYEGSNLKAVLDASDFPKLFDQFLPQLMQKIGQEERDAQEVMNLVSGLAKPMWKHPTAFFFAGVEFPPAGQDNQPPMPKLGLICKAGADADDLHKRIQGLLDMREVPQEVRQFVKAAKVGDSVVVTVGIAPDALPGGNGGAGDALAGNQTFRATLATAAGKVAPVGIFYLDAEKLQDLIDKGLDRYAGPNEKGMWTKVQGNLGLKGLKRLIVTSGFDGKDWQDNLFLEAPAPRTGLLSLFGETPLSDDALKNVPSTATLAGAGKFDANKFLTGLRDLAAGFDPNAAREFDNAMAEASRAIGMDVQKDVLANFGDEWVYYADPNIGGRSVLGFCLINRLKDPAKAEQALVKLQDLVAREVNKEMNRGGGGGGPQPKLSFYTTKSGDTTIHYVGTPLVTPSWAVKNGNLYFGLFPQVVAAAAGHQPGSGKSILDNPDFKALRQRLGAQKPTSVAFMDLPKTAPDAYAQWVMISRLVGFGDMLGVQSPAMLLPPLPKLMQHLSPAGSAAWVDKDGWHVRSITPFPGSTLLASDPTVSALGFAPLLAGIAMPAMARARHVVVEEQSMTNLRQIGMGAMMFASDHKGVFPKTLGELLPYVENDAGLFVYPTSGKASPAGGDPAEAAKWVDANSDYVYLAAGMKVTQIKGTAETVIAHERFGLSPQGVGALFADGHVERLPQAEVQRRAVKPQAGGGSARPESAPPPVGRPAPPRITPPPAPPRPTPPAPRPPRAPQPPR